jgi:prolyl oligopeptidase
LHAGASWIAEYGDPGNPETWQFLKEISTYHAAVPGRPYPPILIATKLGRRLRLSAYACPAG